jgi:hypothetical protein
MCYPLRRYNSDYQVHVMECVPYVGWATCSHATVMTHFTFSKKKIGSSQLRWNVLSFVLSTAIGIRILALASIWTVLDYIDVCNFWKCPFYCRCNANFFLELTRTLISLRIFLGISCWLLLAESCMLTVHNAESDRG